MNKVKTNAISAILIVLVGIGLVSFKTEKDMQTKKVKTIDFAYDGEVINVSADSLWSIVGDDFANAGKWATSVDHSVGSGEPTFEGATCSERSCDLNAKGFSKINEKLTQFDPQKKELTYIVNQGFPGFVTLAQNHWTVVPLSDSTSRLHMNVTMEMKPFMGSLMGGMMKKNLNQLMPVLANDLKVYAETGKVSDSKKARLASIK